MSLVPHLTLGVDGLVRVQSCFGGFAVIRTASLLQAKCTYNERSCNCEHVSFYGCLIQHGFGDIYIDQQLKLDYAKNG